MGRIDTRLAELGIELPPVFPPAGNSLGAVVEGGLVHVGGHGPIAGERTVIGKVGGAVSLEQAQGGMVNVAPGFNRTPQVIDGCSDLLVELFGDAGRHTRSAVGLAELRHRSRDRARRRRRTVSG